jgi:hypothetical protein
MADKQARAPSFGKLLKIWAKQGRNTVPVGIDYDRYIWSGLSWGVGEITGRSFKPGVPITIYCSSAEKQAISLQARLYVVEY